MPKKNLTTKETIHGISYSAWDEKILKKFPITDQHIGLPVKTAFDPNNKKYILLEIKKAGDPQFPQGGYLIEDPDSDFNKPIFPEELISFPPKKKRGRKRKASKKK